MCVRIDEAGENRLSGEIEFASARGGEIQNVIIRAGGVHTVSSDCYRLRTRVCRIHRDDVGAVQNQTWFHAAGKDTTYAGHTCEPCATV
jgi:hypothetical protein